MRGTTGRGATLQGEAPLFHTPHPPSLRSGTFSHKGRRWSLARTFRQIASAHDWRKRSGSALPSPLVGEGGRAQRGRMRGTTGRGATFQGEAPPFHTLIRRHFVQAHSPTRGEGKGEEQKRPRNKDVILVSCIMRMNHSTQFHPGLGFADAVVETTDDRVEEVGDHRSPADLDLRRHRHSGQKAHWFARTAEPGVFEENARLEVGLFRLAGRCAWSGLKASRLIVRIVPVAVPNFWNG